MKKKIDRHSLPQHLLMHILEQPGLVKAVQTLDPVVLTKLVRRIGLEDSGELVAMFTMPQLEEVFDEDLWANERPGEEESFEDQRFFLWLEVLLESGAGVAVNRVSEMDEDLLTLALSRQVLVVNIEELAMHMADSHLSNEDDLLDKQLDSCLYQEFGEFQVISRNHRTWEVICAVPVELDTKHHDILMRLLVRCCHIAHEFIEDNGGLYEVLSFDEMLTTDVLADREERREKKGYVPPASAKSFLSHACVSSLEDLIDNDKLDPITRAHFCVAAEGRELRPTTVPASSGETVHSSRLVELLQEAEVIEVVRPMGLLGSGDLSESETDLPVVSAMRLLCGRDDAAHSQRINELAYLSNLLIAGCEYRFRKFRPLEAAKAALAICNLGAERLQGSDSKQSTAQDAAELAETLLGISLVKAFRVGWHVLHKVIVLPSAEALRVRCQQLSNNVAGSPAE